MVNGIGLLSGPSGFESSPGPCISAVCLFICFCVTDFVHKKLQMTNATQMTTCTSEGKGRKFCWKIGENAGSSGCQHLPVRCLIEDKKLKSKRGIILRKCILNYLP